MFLENQYPGNVNSIASDLKKVARDISMVYQSKQLVGIDEEKVEIPTEAFEYAVRSYQAIEVHQKNKFEIFKLEYMEHIKKNDKVLNDTKIKINLLEVELKNKSDALFYRNNDNKEIKIKLEDRETKLQEYQAKISLLHNENQTLNFDYQSQLKINGDLDSKMKLMIKVRNTLEDKCKQHETERSDLENKITGLNASNEILYSERALQEKQISELRDVIKQLNIKVTSFEEHLFMISNNR